MALAASTAALRLRRKYSREQKFSEASVHSRNGRRRVRRGNDKFQLQPAIRVNVLYEPPDLNSPRVLHRRAPLRQSMATQSCGHDYRRLLQPFGKRTSRNIRGLPWAGNAGVPLSLLSLLLSLPLSLLSLSPSLSLPLPFPLFLYISIRQLGVSLSLITSVISALQSTPIPVLGRPPLWQRIRRVYAAPRKRWAFVACDVFLSRTFPKNRPYFPRYCVVLIGLATMAGATSSTVMATIAIRIIIVIIIIMMKVL